ncbi:MAG: two-component regulator propeller domain-containing protein [Ferruginibacter sp.]
MKSYFLCFICFSAVMFSCKQHSEKTITDEPVTKAIGTVNKDSTAAPEIITMGAPTIIPAPKPKIVPLKYPYGVGKPSIVNYTVADGLPQNLIMDLAIDKQGNLWSAGLGFLSKYDGSHFTNYTMKNGMGDGFVSKILADHNDHIWVGNYSGLYRFDGHAFHPTPLSLYDENINLRGLCEDGKGAIWVATGKGLFSVVGDSLTRFSEKQGLTNPSCNNVFTDKKDRIVVGTSKGSFILEGDKFIPYEIVPSPKGNALILVGKDRQGNLWFTRRHANDENADLIRYDGTASTVYSVKEGLITSRIFEIMEDKNGILWMSGSDKKLIRFDGQQFIYFTTLDGLSSTNINSIAEDDAGNIWVGTEIGISRLSYSYMNKLEKIAEGELSNYQMVIGLDGTRWVLERKNSSHLLVQYREKVALVYDLAVFKANGSFAAILIDKQGQIWLTIWGSSEPGKLIKFDEKSFYIYGKEQGLMLSQLAGWFEDGEGNFWLDGRRTVLKLDGNTITHYSTAQGFPKVFFGFLPDSKGQCWMGGIQDSTIYKFDGAHVTRYSKQDGYLGSFVNTIAEDPFGNIWFATNQGVSRFNGKRFFNYGQIEGMESMVLNISVDTTRRLLWFSTITGLTTLSFDRIDSADLDVHRYSQRNGFDVVPSFLSYTKTYFDSSGIWGSGPTGIYRFDYDKMRQFKEPLLQIRNIRVNNQQLIWSDIYEGKQNINDSLAMLNEAVLKFGRPIDAAIQREQQAAYGNLSFDSLQKGNFIPENLKLPYNNNSITFEFASVSPSFGKYTQYRYMLEGYEKTWSPLSNKDEAFFGNMSEGKYTFRLQAISSTGAQTELSYSFRVLPPWYRTWWAYAAYILLFIAGIYLFIRWRTKALKKDKLILEHKVNVRTNELKESLENLKSTQTQLIQSEKMASLGELTAGIAHEIQNPLNFVNNFSEVSNELIDEMKDELKKGNYNDANEIADDVKQNLEKINHHGKRADAIVKGMLQHSRSSSGVKESTDINALCDEYLRLSYHGLRAKDKSFNATIKTDFDNSIGNINIIPQDIGRVILNLLTNAFYVGDEKKKSGIENYKPTVSISTKKNGDKVEIKVSDNGNGIPQKVLDKIFQPFFTTKPTGQGTGLGLSLSYDIITKGHGGELKVETTEGVGTSFIIVLSV